jgi:hypothetical protein
MVAMRTMTAASFLDRLPSPVELSEVGRGEASSDRVEVDLEQQLGVLDREHRDGSLAGRSPEKRATLMDLPRPPDVIPEGCGHGIGNGQPEPASSGPSWRVLRSRRGRTAPKKFVRDFVVAWDKVKKLDQFDLG